MATIKRDTRVTASQGLACMGIAGVFSKTATCPLDVVKILSQVGTFHCKRGFLNTFRLVYQKEGLRAFWKGNLVACSRLLPYSTVHLSAYKRIVHLHMDELGCISPGCAVVAGGLAGIVAALLTYPLEVAETRLVVQSCRDPSYRGLVHALRAVRRQEGLRALYRGASLTVVGAIPFSLGCYVVYVNLDKLWREPSSHLSPGQDFVNGCVAAGVAQTLSFPFETVKRKMQIEFPPFDVASFATAVLGPATRWLPPTSNHTRFTLVAPNTPAQQYKCDPEF
nr:PREDICTED: solute carrier family 25 member 43 isoform X3 [Lepisosteus oculatus]